MGKHSKPGVGYLPRAAVGAVPLALLLAGPATALAAQPALPLDHQHEGSFDKGLVFGGTPGDKDHSSFLKGFITTANHDVDTARFGDTEIVQRLTTTEEHLENSHSDKGFLALDPATGPVGAASEETDRLFASDSRYDAMRFPHGVDLINQSGEQPELGLARNITLTDDKGTMNALSGLKSGGVLDRSFGQAVDLGDAAAAGANTQQHGSGLFTGSLDLTSTSDGQAASTVAQGLDTALDQTHALGGHAGPLSGTVSSRQSGALGWHGTFQGTLPVEGMPAESSTQQAEATLSDAIRGDLGVDHVLRLSGELETDCSGSGDLDRQSGSFVHESTLIMQPLDQAPVSGGLKISGPPLTITPQQPS